MSARFYTVLLLVILLALATAEPVFAQRADLSFVLTRAEESDFRETTRYDEAMAFVEVVAESSDHVHFTTYGYSVEGRALPLAVFGSIRDARPESVRQSNRVRILIQANIHGGEVEGKEAVLMMLRDMGMGRYDSLLDSVIVLVAPLYNADGNERVSLYNRPRQNGPVGGMGTRANAQGLDLNRDHMKLATPETRSIVRLITEYDPHVIIDLHSTNGTTHAYHLTYSPPLHPATPEAISHFMNERWLPELTTRMLADGYHTYHYGNLPWPGMDAPRGWYTFDYRPRFGTNYAGVRNRLSLLSEAYAYLPFDERIHVTRSLIDHSLVFAKNNASAIRRIVEEADASAVGSSIPLRAEFAPSTDPVEVLLGEVDVVHHPLTGEEVYRRLDVVLPEEMTAYISFRATHSETLPSFYYLPPEASTAVEVLRAHGITVSHATWDPESPLEEFVIERLTRSDRAFQNRHERSAEGYYRPHTGSVREGWYQVDVSQPLGRLASLLLEPMSSDGLLNWGLLDDLLDAWEQEESQMTYPVLRTQSPSPAP